MDFILRPWKADDVDSILKYANNKKIADNLRDAFPHPYTRNDAVWYVTFAMEESPSKNLLFAIDVKGEAVGSIGIFPKDDVSRKSAELGYWLAEPFWNRGIMTNAIRQMTAEAFSRLEIVRIFAEPYARNLPSRRALEKAGFTLEGILKNSIFKNGEILDSCIYALLR